MPKSHPTNRELFLPYVVPYLVYVGLASLPSEWLSPVWSYTLRILATGVAIGWAWRRYAPFRGSGSIAASAGIGVAAGLLGTILWIGLVWPFAPDDAPALAVDAAILRIMAATLLVPIFEEALMRGYVLRLALQWDYVRSFEGDPFGVAMSRSIYDVEPGAWSWMAIAISTAVFTLGHRPFEWPASIAYGLLMCGLWVYRRDLVGCVAAHAVTNATLGLYVITTGAWALW